MNNWIRRKFQTWFPEYTNGTLPPLQHRILDWWINRDTKTREELERLALLRRALQGISFREPSPQVFAGIQMEVKRSASIPIVSRFPWPAWSLGMLLILLAMLISIQTIPPGNQLSWNVDGRNQAREYLVLRAPAALNLHQAAEDFVLVRQVEAQEGRSSYRFFDPFLIPGKNYVYLVQGIEPDGQVISSDPILVRSSDALTGQLVLIGMMLAALAGFGLLTRFESIGFYRQQYS